MSAFKTYFFARNCRVHEKFSRFVPEWCTRVPEDQSEVDYSKLNSDFDAALNE
jgi:hypothetical protein